MEVGTKQCSKCKRILPVSEFYKNKTRKDGLATMCKDCAIEYKKEYCKTSRGKESIRRSEKKYCDKKYNTFGRKRERGCGGILKRDYELTEKELERREWCRRRRKGRKGKCPEYGVLVWYDGTLNDLTRIEYMKVMSKEYKRQVRCAIRGHVARTEPSEHFLFDFDLEKMLDDNVFINRGCSRLYITKWWEGEIRHWTVNDGIWRK